MNYTEAEAACASLGAHLAVPRSEEENQCVADMAGTVSTWLGLSDRAEEGVYAAADGGEPFSRFSPFWAPGEPTSITAANCVHMWAGYNAWDDAGCYHKKSAICEL